MVMLSRQVFYPNLSENFVRLLKFLSYSDTRCYLDYVNMYRPPEQFGTKVFDDVVTEVSYRH